MEILIYSGSESNSMMKMRFLCTAMLVLGIVLVLPSTDSVIGAFAGAGSASASLALPAGIILIIIAIIIFAAEEGNKELESRVETQWKKYEINRHSILEDIEEEYLSREAENGKRTEIQKRIERAVTGGRLIREETREKKPSYEEQFYESHASLGGRIIDVESHIAKSGKNKGKLVHFGQPANARYIWIIDEDLNFIVANRQTMLHEMPHMDKEKVDLPHRLHKLPHSTLSRGKKIYGSGEVLVEGGVVKSFDCASGHYVDVEDIQGFNRQGEEVFRHFIRKFGWKEAKGGAKYVSKHD
jgi:hypothetical protein